MSVLIKGMDMPTMPQNLTQGEAVPYIDVRIFADGNTVTSKGERPYYTEYCAVSVPTPHGRLIDGDYLYERFKANGCPDDKVYRFIREEPPVIEAEE